MSIPQDSSWAQMEDVRAYLLERVRPLANAIDSDRVELESALAAIGRQGLLGLRVPVELGGKGLTDSVFRIFQEACSRASGALAFLQTQHQSACSFILKGSNEALKRAVLPVMARGESLYGIAFSQLRKRSSGPMLTASPIAEGFLLNGTAPWFTGAGIFGGSVTAATLPSGDTIFVRHSLTTEGLALSEPLKLAAFEVAQTVSAKFDDCFIPETDVIGVESPDWIDSNDMLNISLQSPFALGCAAAGLDCVAENFQSKGIRGIDSAHRSLLEELERCRTEAFAAMDDRADNRRGLRARAWAISMAFRCAQAAIVSSSGAGNSMNHAAQRIYREALVFAVSAQTTDIMEATLAKITEESSSEA